MLLFNSPGSSLPSSLPLGTYETRPDIYTRYKRRDDASKARLHSELLSKRKFTLHLTSECFLLRSSGRNGRRSILHTSPKRRSSIHARLAHLLREFWCDRDASARLSCRQHSSAPAANVHGQCLFVIGEGSARLELAKWREERSPARDTARRGRSSFGLHYVDWILSAPHLSAFLIRAISPRCNLLAASAAIFSAGAYSIIAART